MPISRELVQIQPTDSPKRYCPCLLSDTHAVAFGISAVQIRVGALQFDIAPKGAEACAVEAKR